MTCQKCSPGTANTTIRVRSLKDGTKIYKCARCWQVLDVIEPKSIVTLPLCKDHGNITPRHRTSQTDRKDTTMKRDKDMAVTRFERIAVIVALCVSMLGQLIMLSIAL